MDAMADAYQAALDANVSSTLLNQNFKLAKLIVQLCTDPSRRGDRGLQQRLKMARTFDGVVSACSSIDQPDDSSAELANLRARVAAAEAGEASVTRKLAQETLKRENAELFSREASAEADDLKKALKREKESVNAYYHQILQLQASAELHTDEVEKLEKIIARQKDYAKSLQDRIDKDRVSFQAATVAQTAQSIKLHKLLSEMSKDEYDETKVLRDKYDDMVDTLRFCRRANGILRQHVDARQMDADTLVLASAGIGSGDINLDRLDLDPDSRKLLKECREEVVRTGKREDLAISFARAMYRKRHGIKRKRIRQAPVGSGDDDEESDSDVQ
ncbi:hypothetical protein PHYBOEH_001896 [Phytophthora boehmeriae]|uniref:Uncharacterized protein n=1 Tax=Phytophthora boehmeriae TaxID=109152 RepID=A0A8T1V4Q3_9STRA|nr:hypothetical protein PHYBOEH_001896 [Phytophthora boehmeriae]